MLKAATFGAVAFQKGLGACHSLAHPLSAEYGTHHGLANAMCLPAVLDFNRSAVQSRISEVARCANRWACLMDCAPPESLKRGCRDWRTSPSKIPAIRRTRGRVRAKT